MIAGGTILSLQEVSLLPELVASWENGEIKVSPCLVQAQEYSSGFEVETWFADGCRECQHSSNRGFTIGVSPGQQFLMKSGAYASVEELQPGHRLFSDGECGYEEVKSVKKVRSQQHWSVVGPSNYKVSDGGTRSLFLKTDMEVPASN